MTLAGSIQMTCKSIQSRPPQHGIILMYHRVTASVVDPWGLCVSPENFGQHLEVLRQSYRPVCLKQLATVRNIRSRMVALTFDDGYADNLHIALPILERYNIPATFFLVSGALGTEREFWWDELERLLLRPQSLPPTLQVTIGSSNHLFEVGPATRSFAASRREISYTRPWKAAVTTRLGFYYKVWRWLKMLDDDARRSALAQLREQLGEAELTRASHRVLTRTEAICLAGAPHIDIGAHSVTHAALPAQPPHAQRQEMHQSRRDLEALIGRSIAGFAYPFGAYAPETPDLARDIGFAFACTTEAGRVTSGTEPFLLPRVEVTDCSGAEFARCLEEAMCVD